MNIENLTLQSHGRKFLRRRFRRMFMILGCARTLLLLMLIIFPLLLYVKITAILATVIVMKESCRTSAKVCEIDKRLTAYVDRVCLDAIHDCGKYKVQGMCLSKKYAEARDENGYFDHNSMRKMNAMQKSAKRTQPIARAWLGKYRKTMVGPEVYTYANDLRYYSSTQLPESVKLDRAIHILEHYGNVVNCIERLLFQQSRS